MTPELKCRMGVSSGLELVTLPHGRQLRLDLMERFISHTQSRCHTEIDNFSILSHQQGNRLRHNTRVLSIKCSKTLVLPRFVTLPLCLLHLLHQQGSFCFAVKSSQFFQLCHHYPGIMARENNAISVSERMTSCILPV